MKRIGQVWRIGAGVVVLRSHDDAVPDVGAEVVSETLEPIGTIVDVMGPVDRPYVVISPLAEEPSASLLNEPLYVR